MACDACDPHHPLAGLYQSADLQRVLGEVPREAGQMACRDCGVRWVLTRRQPEMIVFLARAAELPLRFEGRWSFSQNAGRPGEGDSAGYFLTLVREGDRL